MPVLPTLPEPPKHPEQILAEMLEKRDRLIQAGQQLANKEIIPNASPSEK